MSPFTRQQVMSLVAIAVAAASIGALSGCNQFCEPLGPESEDRALEYFRRHILRDLKEGRESVPVWEREAFKWVTDEVRDVKTYVYEVVDDTGKTTRCTVSPPMSRYSSVAKNFGHYEINVTAYGKGQCLDCVVVSHTRTGLTNCGMRMETVGSGGLLDGTLDFSKFTSSSKIQSNQNPCTLNTWPQEALFDLQKMLQY